MQSPVLSSVVSPLHSSVPSPSVTRRAEKDFSSTSMSAAPSVKLCFEIFAVGKHAVAAEISRLRRLGLCYVESLFDVQLPRLSVGAQSAVVVYAVGAVGILLNLGNEHSAADGVDGARGNEETIALFNVYRARASVRVFSLMRCLNSSLEILSLNP